MPKYIIKHEIRVRKLQEGEMGDLIWGFLCIAFWLAFISMSVAVCM